MAKASPMMELKSVAISRLGDTEITTLKAPEDEIAGKMSEFYDSTLDYDLHVCYATFVRISGEGEWELVAAQSNPNCAPVARAEILGVELFGNEEDDG